MSNTTTLLGTTPSGKLIHVVIQQGRHMIPACNQSRGIRGNGRMRIAYGAAAPTCPHCLAATK